MTALPNIVLVHGAWADGSSWSAVIERLQADGYHVTAPQFPMTRLADDVARLRQVLARQNGPTLVAGHSYGGQIITALGADTLNVVGLVYIAAFGLDEGESIGALLEQVPGGPALAHLDVDQHSFAWLPEDDFVNHFAADVDPVKARYCPARRSSSMYPTHPRSRPSRRSISSRPRPATSSQPRRQPVWAIMLRCPSSAQNACRTAVTSERSWRAQLSASPSTEPSRSPDQSSSVSMS